MITKRSFHRPSRRKNGHGSWSSTNSATIHSKTPPTTLLCSTGSSTSAANIPAKFVEARPVGYFGAWGGLRYLGDSNPVWDSVVKFNGRV